MKKALACSLSLALLLSLTACNKPQAEDQPDNSQSDNSAATSAQVDISIPEPDNTPKAEQPKAPVPEQLSDTIPAAPTEDEAPQDQVDTITKEPVETETPKPVETKQPDTPPKENKPTEPEQEKQLSDGDDSAVPPPPQDPHNDDGVIVAPDADLSEIYPDYDGPRDGFTYWPGFGYVEDIPINDTGIRLNDW